jgi:hypothetical protein
MNREEAKKLIPTIQAFAEGKKIQCRGVGHNFTGGWLDIDNPTWDRRTEYRVAPEIVKAELWCVVNARTGVIWFYSSDETHVRAASENAVHDVLHQKVIKLEGSYER